MQVTDASYKARAAEQLSPPFPLVICYLPAMGRSPFVADLVFEILDNDDHWWPRDLARLAVVSNARRTPAPNIVAPRICLDRMVVMAPEHQWVRVACVPSFLR